MGSVVMRNPVPVAPELGLPVYDLRISELGLPDHDLADGLPHRGLRLLNKAHYTGPGGSLKIQDNGSGKQVLRAITSTTVGRLDGTDQSAGIIQVVQDLADLNRSLVSMFTIRLEFEQVDSGGVGMDVSGAGEAVFCGVADNVDASPGAVAGSVAAYGWFGNDATGVAAREGNSLSGGVLSTWVSSASWGSINNKWVQLRIGLSGLSRISADLRFASGAYSRHVDGTIPAASTTFRNSLAGPVRGFFGVQSLGTSSTVDIERVSVYMLPGLVP